MSINALFASVSKTNKQIQEVGGDRTLRLRDTSPTRQFAHSFDSLPTGLHVVNALTQLFMHSNRDHYTL